MPDTHTLTRVHACTHAHTCNWLTLARSHTRTHAERSSLADLRSHAHRLARTHAFRVLFTHADTPAYTYIRRHACTHAPRNARALARTYARTFSPTLTCTHARTHAGSARTHACTQLLHRARQPTVPIREMQRWCTTENDTISAKPHVLPNGQNGMTEMETEITFAKGAKRIHTSIKQETHTVCGINVLPIVSSGNDGKRSAIREMPESYQRYPKTRNVQGLCNH